MKSTIDNKELLEIFPEAKPIIKRNLRLWKQEKQRLLKEEIQPFFDKADKQDAFTAAYWKERYVYTATGYGFVCDQIKRLNLLNLLITNPKEYEYRIQNLLSIKSIPIETLIPFNKLRKNHARSTTECPLHDDPNPSLVIYHNNNTWHCFQCSQSGDNIELVRKVYKLSFKQALHFIKERGQ